MHKLILSILITIMFVALASPAAYAQQGAPSATLNWNSVTVPTPAALTYKVQRATAAAGPFTQVGQPATSSFVDTTVQRGITYFWRVVASCPAAPAAGCGTTAAPVNGDSGPSNTATAMIPNASTVPPTPTNLTIDAVQ